MMWAGRCRRRRCRSYAPTWVRDVEQVLFRAMEAYDRLHAAVPIDVRKVKLGMVTAPGADVLPWDEERCKVPVVHTHSGALRCECEKRAADGWNLRCSREWTRLHARCAQRVERRLGYRPYMVLRAFEYQWRGVLHVHPVLGYSTARERAAADAYLAELEKLAPEYGFGWKSGGGAKVIPAGAAAAYASAYCVGKSSGHGGKRKLTTQEWVTDETAVIPNRPYWVRPDLMQASGYSMRTCRLRRWAWCLVNRSGCVYLDGLIVNVDTWEVVMEYPLGLRSRRGPPAGLDGPTTV